MLATQLITGHGGWPNNVFLTPDLKPFFAGSYFDPTDGDLGRPGFPTVLYGSWPNMIHAWVIGEFEGEGAIRFPVYPMRTILIVGSVVLALEFLARAARDVRPVLGVNRTEPEAIVLPTGR
jgi:hypothetical protein